VPVAETPGLVVVAVLLSDVHQVVGRAELGQDAERILVAGVGEVAALEDADDGDAVILEVRLIRILGNIAEGTSEAS
jgi:hypothetical protein